MNCCLIINRFLIIYGVVLLIVLVLNLFIIHLFVSGHVMSQRLGISSHLLSRITGSIFVVDAKPGSSSTENARKTNIGLNLKFNKKNEEVRNL